MSEGWRAIGDVLAQVNRSVVVAEVESVPYAGVRWYAGGVYLREVADPASVKAKKLARIREGDVIYNRMWATRASFGIARADVDGCLVTNDFPTFETNSDLAIVDFVGLILQTEDFQAEAALRASGTTERRRLKERDFLSIEIRLPPLPEQRRIVDLIDALDEAIKAAEQSAVRLFDLAQNLLTEAFGSDEKVRISEYADVLVGYAFKSSEYSLEGVRLLRGDNIKPGGTRWSEAKFISSEVVNSQLEKYSLEAEDVVLAMDRPVISSGVKAARIGTDDLPALLVQRVARLRPRDLKFGRLIELAFGSREFQAYLESGQAGSHVPHINGSQIAGFEVPSSLFQGSGSSPISSANYQSVTATEYAASLRTLRPNLLTALLSGEHEIPATYDALLEVPA